MFSFELVSGLVGPLPETLFAKRRQITHIDVVFTLSSAINSGNSRTPGI